ncbi:MAG TPA: hypothetical protein VH478_14560 [Trebonia sp.]|nr:hypothetical protein [Trebonia sp.]
MADVLLLAVDSWGGVASMIALAGGLRDMGVSTRIAAYSDFGDKVRAAGCGFVDLQVSQADWWESQNAQQSDWAKNPLRTLKALRAGGKADARATATRLTSSNPARASCPARSAWAPRPEWRRCAAARSWRCTQRR